MSESPSYEALQNRIRSLEQTKAELEKSKNELHRIFSMSLDMICIADLRTAYFLKVNRAFEKTLGYREAELQGKPFFDFIHPDDVQPTLSILENELRSGTEVINFENRYRCKHGGYRWLSWVSHPDVAKGITYAVARDVTRIKQTEAELRESEERYKSLFNAINDGICLHEMVYEKGEPVDYRIIDINPKYEELTGIGKAAAIGSLATRLYMTDEAPYLNVYAEVSETGKPVSFETYFAPMDKHFLISVFSPDKNRFATVFQDITKSKKTIEALAESEERYRSVLEAVDEGIVLQAASGEILTWNKGAEKIFGISSEDAVGRMSHNTNWPTIREDGSKYEGKDHPSMKTLRTGAPCRNEVMGLLQPDGNVRWISINTDPLFRENEKTPYAVAISFSDITDRKHAETEKRKMENQLHQARKLESIGRLAGGVAHDFNNMLSIISGNVEIALEDIKDADPVVSNLQEIQKAAHRSTDLTRQLLAFARKQTIAPKILDLNETIQGMLKMLRRLIGEHIDLAWLPHAGLWPVSMDPSQLDQVLANLCVNARDAIRDVGKITIETGNVRFDEDYCQKHDGFRVGEYVLMAVSDNGDGMDDKTLNNVFEPFFTTKAVGRGTGLGLATVYGIVKQNNGFINVYSEPRRGTTFKLYFPRHREKTVEDQSGSKREADAVGNETILLVEDEKGILKMATLMLERLGYHVIPASGPSEAIRSGEQYAGNIDLLMTDVVMPEMSGREMAEALLRSYPDLKCLFMSGYTANVIAHHGILDDGVQFINKPFSKQDLAAKIRDVLDSPK